MIASVSKKDKTSPLEVCANDFTILLTRKNELFYCEHYKFRISGQLVKNRANSRLVYHKLCIRNDTNNSHYFASIYLSLKLR